MDPKEAIVSKGMISLLTGLGILLGAGRISSATYEQIQALLNGDEGSSNLLDTGKETPVSFQSHDLNNDMRNLKLADRPSPRRPARSLSTLSPKAFDSSQWPSMTRMAPSSNSQTNGSSEGSVSRIVCPWFLMDGYRCREQEKGLCAWLHEDGPGVRDPLICSFWAAADQNCNKSDEECRFAHYWATHRQIAPAPNSKHKKHKKPSHHSEPSW